MEDKFTIVEEEVLALVGQIEFGDITDIWTYWKSLRDTLLKLDICEGIINKYSVSDILKNLPESYLESSLIDITLELEEKTSGSSSDSIEDDELTDIKALAIDFEEKFMDLITRISDDSKRK